MLSVLPAELRRELSAALTSLDSEQIAATLSKIGVIDAELEVTLFRLAKYFDYPAILKALDEFDEPEQAARP